MRIIEALIILLMHGAPTQGQSTFIYEADYLLCNCNESGEKQKVTTVVVHTYDGSIRRGHFVLIDEEGGTVRYEVYHFNELKKGLIWKWYVFDENKKKATIAIKADTAQAYRYEILVRRKDVAPFVLFANKRE